MVVVRDDIRILFTCSGFLCKGLKKKKKFCFSGEHLPLQWMINLQCDFMVLVTGHLKYHPFSPWH